MFKKFEKSGFGFSVISRLLKSEKNYPDDKKFINISPGTVRKRLIDWEIKIRSPKYRNPKRIKQI